MVVSGSPLTFAELLALLGNPEVLVELATLVAVTVEAKGGMKVDVATVY